MRTLGIRIANWVLFALCSFQVAALFNRVAAEALRTAPTYEVTAVSEDSAPRSATDGRAAILDRNLFGAQIVPQPVVPEPVEAVEETKLPLALEATIAATGTTDSRASILDTRARVSMVVGVGDLLEGYANVSVALIERGRVVLLNAGRHEELLLEEGAPAPPPGRRPSAATRRGRKQSAAKAPARRSRPPSSSRSPDRPRPVRDLEEADRIAEGIRERLQAGEFSEDELRGMLEGAAEQAGLQEKPAELEEP